MGFTTVGEWPYDADKPGSVYAESWQHLLGRQARPSPTRAAAYATCAVEPRVTRCTGSSVLPGFTLGSATMPSRMRIASAPVS